MRSLSRAACAPWLAVIGTCLLGGCSGATPEQLYAVTGTVRVGDRVLDSGTIQFEMIKLGASGKIYTSSSTIESDGSFTLYTFGQPGAPAGKHRVWVIPDNARAPDKVGINPLLLTPIPRKYMQPTTTDIEVEVKPQPNDLQVVVPTK